MSLHPSDPGSGTGEEAGGPDTIDVAREEALDGLARWARAVVEALEVVCAGAGVRTRPEDQPAIAFHGSIELLHDGKVVDEELFQALSEREGGGEGFVEERETCSAIHLHGGDARGGRKHVVLSPQGGDAGLWAEAVRCWAALREVLSHQWAEEIPAGFVLELEDCVVGAWECECGEGAPSYLVELATEEGAASEDELLADLLAEPEERHRAAEERFLAILAHHEIAPPQG